MPSVPILRVQVLRVHVLSMLQSVPGTAMTPEAFFPLYRRVHPGPAPLVAEKSRPDIEGLDGQIDDYVVFQYRTCAK